MFNSQRFLILSFAVSVISFAAFLVSIVAYFIGLISINTVLMLLWFLILSIVIELFSISLSVFSHYKKQKDKINGNKFTSYTNGCIQPFSDKTTVDWIDIGGNK